MDAVLSIEQRVLVGYLGQRQRLIAHAQAGRIHHHKHAIHAFVGRTHQGARSAVQNHLTGGASFDAHFVLQAATVNTIARAQTAVFMDQKLGHDEQAHAFDSGRRIA